MKYKHIITLICIMPAMFSCKINNTLAKEEKDLINNASVDKPFKVLLTTNEQVNSSNLLGGSD